jgi:hypothetical protein
VGNGPEDQRGGQALTMHSPHDNVSSQSYEGACSLTLCQESCAIAESTIGGKLLPTPELSVINRTVSPPLRAVSGCAIWRVNQGGTAD